MNCIINTRKSYFIKGGKWVKSWRKKNHRRPSTIILVLQDCEFDVKRMNHFIFIKRDNFSYRTLFTFNGRLSCICTEIGLFWFKSSIHNKLRKEHLDIPLVDCLYIGRTVIDLPLKPFQHQPHLHCKLAPTNPLIWSSSSFPGKMGTILISCSYKSFTSKDIEAIGFVEGKEMI